MFLLCNSPPSSAGNAKRDRIRTLLSEGLLMVPQSEADADAGKVAADVESAVFDLYPSMAADYAAKVGNGGQGMSPWLCNKRAAVT
jgi:hypothetical protein